MTWIIEFLFGPTVPENPNYEVIQDVTSLFPWWYPHLVMTCLLLFLILLWAAHHKKSATVSPSTSVAIEAQRDSPS